MDVIMPQLGETVAEGTVTKWHKKAGDAVKADEPLFDVETDKVSTEIPAPVSGVLAEIVVHEGVTAKVGTRLAVIRESASAPQEAARGPAPSTAAPITASVPGAQSSTPISLLRGGAQGKLSPVVSRLLAEHGLNAGDVAGTGRDGRITREDVLAHVAKRGGAPRAVGTQDAEPRPSAEAAAEKVPLNNIRKRTAEHMTKAWTTVPHVLQAVEVDFSRVDTARRARSLTYLPFIARSVVMALAKFKRLNASFGGDHLVVHRRVNLGIAVDLDRDGLMVPVVKDAAAKNVSELARAINDLAGRARSGKLRPDDMTEGTYTISNNGAFGTLITAPIISAPQVAILSTDGVRKRPVVVEGDRIEVRPVGILAHTFDHRAVDGAYSAAFLNELRTIIETADWGKELEG